VSRCWPQPTPADRAAFVGPWGVARWSTRALRPEGGSGNGTRPQWG